jgi:hypothetical protein
VRRRPWPAVCILSGPPENSLTLGTDRGWVHLLWHQERCRFERAECNQWEDGLQNGAFFGPKRCNARHFLRPPGLLVSDTPGFRGGRSEIHAIRFRHSSPPAGRGLEVS